MAGYYIFVLEAAECAATPVALRCYMRGVNLIKDPEDRAF
ncbi:Uncharacterised protein [Yersinia intermedia]|nr:Uncharacterised protein [Yersinia intermedia]